MRVVKQAMIVLALLLCLPMAVLAFLASIFVTTVEALVRASDD